MSTDVARTPESAQADGERSRDGVRSRHGARAVRFLKMLVRDIRDDEIDHVGAMMAYYTILALFPMLMFVITIGLLVIDESTILQGVAIATEAMPVEVRDTVSEQVARLIHTADAGFAFGGAAFALWGASRGTVALMKALDATFSVDETRPWWRRQLTAIAVTLVVALLVVAALGLLVVGPIAGHWVADRLGLGSAFDLVWGVGRWLGAGLLVMVVWAILYRFLPNSRAPFRIFTPGALVGVVLWLAISYAFGAYLANFARYEHTYGTLGGAIIFLTWLWLSNIALLFGAEINDVLAKLRASE